MMYDITTKLLSRYVFASDIWPTRAHVMHQARQRGYDWRAKVGGRALELVRTLYQSEGFQGDKSDSESTRAIAEHVEIMIGDDFPFVFANPSSEVRHKCIAFKEEIRHSLLR